MRATPSIGQRVGTWVVINSSSQPVINSISRFGFYTAITVNPGVTNANQSGAYTLNSSTYLEFGAEL